jgi:hypothetical protein
MTSVRTNYSIMGRWGRLFWYILSNYGFASIFVIEDLTFDGSQNRNIMLISINKDILY